MKEERANRKKRVREKGSRQKLPECRKKIEIKEIHRRKKKREPKKKRHIRRDRERSENRGQYKCTFYPNTATMSFRVC